MILNVWLSKDSAQPTKVSLKKYQEIKDSLKHNSSLINYKDAPSQKADAVSISR
jgi:hypothetical protein